MAEALKIDRDNKSDTDFTDMPVGEILRRTRLHYGQSIQEVQKNTRIRAHLIEAIESNDLEKLPARVYAIGFLRSYAEYLGLDGDKMVELFKAQAGTNAAEPNLHSPAILEDHSSTPLWVIVVATLTLLVLVGVWSSSGDEAHKNTQTIPPIPQEIQDSILKKEKPSARAPKSPKKSEAESKPPPSPYEAALREKPEIQSLQLSGITINVLKNSWIEIEDKSGKKLISKVLKTGDQYFVPNRPDLLMSLGNAAGVEILIDGVQLKPLGHESEVQRKIPLDVGFLKANYAKP